jgi:hypothetical protein
MSRMTTEAETMEVLEFAKKAARKFKKNPSFVTYTEHLPVPGCLLAMRWGMGEDCVLVIKLDESFEPVNFQQLIKTVKEE